MSNKRVLIFGGGGQALVIYDILKAIGGYNFVGVVANETPNSPLLREVPYLKEDALGDKLKTCAGIVAVGDNWVRSKIVDGILSKNAGFEFISAIHPSAVIGANVKIGVGTAIMAGAVVNPETRIGKHCVVNTGATVEHECALADFASIGPGAVIGGATEMGSHSVVGLGAAVIHGLKIGSNTVVGAGAAAVESFPDDVLVLGVPAKVVRSRKLGEKYL